MDGEAPSRDRKAVDSENFTRLAVAAWGLCSAACRGHGRRLGEMPEESITTLVAGLQLHFGQRGRVGTVGRRRHGL
jgi:hypothetical protein